MNGEMTTRTIQSISDARGVKRMTTTEVKKLREEAKETMWAFYSVNKSNYHESIGDFREEIIVELMKGIAVEEVFESYARSGVSKAA